MTKLRLKIKTRPEDFIVEEIAQLPLRGKKETYAVYLLKKRNWNTVDLLLMLARKFNIPFRDLSYGGKKDRYGLTTQYITIRERPYLKEESENFSMEFIGFMLSPMNPSFIQGNHFKIKIRNIKEKDILKASEEAGRISSSGYPNYFDDQRFGSFDRKQGFIGEKIIRKHFNGALKIYLTSIHPGNRKEEKDRKKDFFDNWGNWKVCQDRAKSRMEQSAFTFLLSHPRGFLPILQRISSEEMSLFFSAYQAFLFNEALRKLIQEEAPSFLHYPGTAGDYVFYKELLPGSWSYLKDLKIPTASSHMKFQDEKSKDLCQQVFREHNIKPAMFNLREIRQAFYKSTDRQVLAFPRALTCAVEDDELYPDKKKMALDFSLPRGSYGTMLVKRLFAASGLDLKDPENDPVSCLAEENED